jgi:hypothetical protein
MLPINVAMLNRGNSRLSSSSACRINSISEAFIYVMFSFSSAIITFERSESNAAIFSDLWVPKIFPSTLVSNHRGVAPGF